MTRSDFYRHYRDLSPQTQLAEENTKEGMSEGSSSNFLARIKTEIFDTVELYKNLGLSVWNYMLITLLNFAVTLCVFPAITALAESYDSDPAGNHFQRRLLQKLQFCFIAGKWSQIFYVPVCCFVVFNLGDYVGKQVAVWVQRPGPSVMGQVTLLLLAILRIGLIPLFMFSNVSVGNRSTGVIFTSDSAYIVFVILLGVSNGYVGNIAMMFGPKMGKQKEHQETAAAAIVAVLVIGCGIGSVISNGLVKAL